MEDRTHNSVKFGILNVIDEYTRECLADRVTRSLTSHHVIEVLADLFIETGVPVHIRLGNGLKFSAKRVRDWLERLQVRPLFTETGSPLENGYIESLNGKMRDELHNLDIFYSLQQARVMVEMKRRHYQTIRPRSALRYSLPLPASIIIKPSQIHWVGLL